MGVVMIKCPKTGREISTGITTDRVRFNSTPVFFASTYCPICRATHEWFAKDAWVCETVPTAAEPMGRISAPFDALAPLVAKGGDDSSDAQSAAPLQSREPRDGKIILADMV
jgi:hypothetical protein